MQHMKRVTTQSNPQVVNWGQLMRFVRTSLHENQQQFGNRFNVTHATISHWERGITDIPGSVTWWLLTNANGAQDDGQ